MTTSSSCDTSIESFFADVDTTQESSEFDSDSIDSLFLSDSESDLSSLNLSTISDASTTSNNESPDEDDSGVGEQDDEVYAKPLYAGGNLTVMESYLMIMKYSLRHSLTKEALGELLDLLDAHLPESSMVSVYKLRKYFLSLYEDITFEKHYCCAICHSPLEKVDSSCCNGCNADSIEFLSIGIEAQLRRKFQDPSFRSNIQKRLSTPQDTDSLRDIYDGREYQKHHEFLSQLGNISFTLNTDGVQMFNSSTISLWPIWLVINELPPQIRFSKKNVILAGLWFSNKKPTMSTFLKPVIDEINQFSTKGFSVTTPEGNLTVKARLLTCSVDLPARAILINMKQYNGAYGCCYCEDEGVPRERSSLQRNWPFTTPNISRTHCGIISNAKKATNQKPDKGIKGASILCSHKVFDLSTGCVIDYMHSVCLGVGKKLMVLWLSQSRHSFPFSIRKKVKLCDERMRNIRIPHEFNRTPRALSQVKQWKASEYRSWMIYYSLPVLDGILPNPYYTHYSLLVAAMYVFLGNGGSISHAMIEKADKYISQFCAVFSRLYGEDACTMNVHMLRHLADCVRNWGPMWAYSCFQFEAMNGHLRKLHHGTKNMNVQLAFSYILQQMLPEKPSNQQNMCELSDCHPIGPMKITVLDPDIKQAINTNFRANVNIGTVITRAIINGTTYYSQLYNRVTKRNSYSVAYLSDGILKLGFIQYFVSLSSFTIAIITPLTIRDDYCYPSKLQVLRSFSFPVLLTPSTDVVPVRNLLYKCVCINADGNSMYIVRQPNKFYYFE